ncbi:MAG: hypothetical protein EP330_05790 [Deltaproteobacteria bacterium]|nr:MAG: hypothetical protein EP330_05790 [Deltaproteobacteria bacterium]
MLTLTALLVGSALAADVDRVPEDFATIQDAVDHGTASVIVVGPGQWAGATVDRPVSIQGKDAVIVSGTRKRGAAIAFPMKESASGSEIVGFTFDCTSKKLDLGVYASVQHMGGAPDEVNVSNNTFLSCVQGVTNTGSRTEECESGDVDGGKYWTVQGNDFRGFSTHTDTGSFVGGIGVYMFNVSSNDVYNNTFSGWVQDTPKFTTGGIVLAGCKDCVIAENNFAVGGGKYYWASVSNLGYYQDGAAPSERVSIVANNAAHDAAPYKGTNFRSIDSFEVELDENNGGVYVDHGWCGDGETRRPVNTAARPSAPVKLR